MSDAGVAQLLGNRYEPLEQIGSGGEGRVLRALDRQHGRQVALKVRSVPRGSARQELLREARVLLALEPHPGLPLVRDDFFHDDEYVIVLDWIEGTDLGGLLREQGTPGLAPSTVLRTLAQAAEALTFLHGHDPPVVHGDVKPANLVLTEHGRVILVDFGLASSGEAAARAGTAGFVAPEVAAGKPPTPASDVFSLAMTALALLTGRPPQGEPPGWPAGLDAERRRVFEGAIRAGTATDPSRRPSAGRLVELLRAGWEADLPTGVVTFCATDVSGSADLWEAQPHAMRRALVRHDVMVAQVVERHGGRLLDSTGEGDSTLSVFTAAPDAVQAATDLVGATRAEPWPDDLRIDIRVGLHTGEAELGGGHLGPTADLAGRIRALADGDQVFLSAATAELVAARLPDGLDLVDLGAHSVRGLGPPQSVYALSASALPAVPSPAECPYRGLLAFEPDDAALYFGREGVVREVVARLGAGRFVSIVGASGSGKSSLVRAGVLAAARRGDIGGVSRTVLLTPGTDPPTALAAADPNGRADLLVVDQLEEAFTLCFDDEPRARFFTELLNRRGKVVVVLRGDFFGHCAAYPDLARHVSANNVLLGPMAPSELKRAVEEPARARGLRCEPGLVELVLRDAAAEPGALPLLSHALMETWARRDSRTLTIAGYRAAGGVRGAIARTAEELFDAAGEDERSLVRRVFLRLTEPGDGIEDTRRRVPLRELTAASEPPAAVDDLLHELVQARLLTVDDGSVELAHEALIREWPRLRGWLDEDRESLRVHRHLTRAAQAWEEMGREPGELYRGARLGAALDWAADRDDLTADERAFLAASSVAQERELSDARSRARRLRILLAGAVALLALALAAGALALVQRGRARHSATLAEAGRLAAQSREVVPQHPDLALLLALEAVRRDDSVDSRGALLGALEHASRVRAWLQGFESPVNATAFSPDGRLLATTTWDGTTLWDTATWKPVGRPLRSSQGGWEGVDFSPDGRTLAISGGKGRVELWDVATRKLRRKLVDPAAARSHEPALASVSYSPDGRVVAAGSQEANHLTLWNAASGRVIGRPITVLPTGTGGAQWISFSPDSRRFVAPGAPGTVGIWEVATGRRVGAPIAIGSTVVDDALFARGGRTLIASADDGSVSFVDVRTGRPVREPRSVGDKPAGALALSPDERLLAVASYQGPVHVWDTKTGTPYGTPLTADTSAGNDVAFSPDGRTLVSSDQRSAVVWNMSGERAIGRPLGGPTDPITDVAFSPDGGRIVAGRYDGDTVVYETASQRPLLRIHGGSVVTAVAFHPGGKLIAVGTIDGKVRFFGRETGAAVGAALDEGNLPVWQVAFSPDGKLLAVAVDRNGVQGLNLERRQGEVQLWRVDSRRRVGRAIVPGAGSVLSVAFSPDGTLLATGSYFHRVDLWDVSTQARAGKPLEAPDDGFTSVAFDPSGRLVAGGGAIGPVRVWRVAGRQAAFPPLTGHTGSVTGMSFDPRRSYLATTSQFGATRLWDAATGLGYGDELISEKPASLEPSAELPYLPRNRFSPDGGLLAVAGVDTRAMLWDVDPTDWRRRACAMAGRNLSREQWRLYLPGAPYRATCPEWPTG